MMRFIAVLVAASGLAAVAPAEFAVTIAPDQPIPHVYVDDVLVLEIASDRDVAAHVRVAISDAAGAEEPALDSDMPLRAQGIRWIPLENVALRRGRYIARVTIEAGGETSESTHPFCRIDRPASVQAPPVGATIDTPEPYAMLAMRDLPLHKVCFAANSPELATLVEAVVQSGLSLGHHCGPGCDAPGSGWGSWTPMPRGSRIGPCIPATRPAPSRLPRPYLPAANPP